MDEEQQKLAEELLFAEEKPKSFAKSLYSGDIFFDSVFPFPDHTIEEKKVVDSYVTKVVQFMNAKLDPIAIDRNANIPDEVIQGLGELGVLGMTVPKEYGGLGMSQYAYSKVIEAIARRCSSTALLVNAHQSIGLRALLLFGTDEQKKRWLPAMAQGKCIGAFSLTEPNAGSDASGVETKAVYDPKKKVYRLNGRKQWTTNGSIAGVLTVMAQTEVDGKNKITAFLVTPDMPGFHILDPALEKVGMRGTKTANLEFRDMEVPEENILGKKGAGLKICLTVLDYGRTTFGAMCTGISKFLVENAIEHSRTRIQFGQPLCAFPLVQEKIAVMSAYTYAMDATTYLTAGLVDKGVEDFMLESAILKVFCSDQLWQTIFDTMQIFGGRSFFTDRPFERIMRDSRLNTIGEGSNEVMRAFIGAVGMRDVGVSMKGALDGLLNPFSNFGETCSRLKQLAHLFMKPKIPFISYELDQPAQKIAALSNKFSRAVFSLLKKYREKVVDHQLELNRIAEGAMGLYAAYAVLAKIDNELRRKNENGLTAELTNAKYFIEIISRRIEKALSEIGSPLDALTIKTANTLTRFTPK
jgi:alkylation response protein AidB-like acyl-CoA dehydrogenase